MAANRRSWLSALTASALVGGVTATLFVGPGNRPLIAQNTAQTARQERVTALSLEGAFTGIAETVGPATVSISAQIERPAATRRAPQIPGNPGEKAPENFQVPPGLEELFPNLRTPRGQAPGTMPNLPAPRRGRVGGSGVIVRADGYILTNDHVVEDIGNQTVKVTLSNGESFPGTVYHDPRSDLAVIKIDAGRPLPFVRFADSEKLKVGQWAVAIGSPFGQQNTMTTGIVSALHRKATIQTKRYPTLIQTDASINPGNSGGPLLNINGDLIGINVAIYSPTDTSAGIGFAIPANTARFVMEQLIERGRVVRGSLGVVPDDIAPEMRKVLGTDRGAYISEVAPDTPADKAGILPGDLILSFDRTPVNDESSLRDAIAAAGPGKTVTLALRREGKPLTITATLAKLDEESAAPANAPAAKPAATLGFRVESLDGDARSELGIASAVKGVIVAGVESGGPAADAGLLPGFVVTHVNGKPVSDITAFNASVAGVKTGEIVSLRGLRPSGGDRAPNRAVVNVVLL